MTYVEKALSRITSEFQNSPLLLAMLAAIIKPLDDLQADADEIKTKRWIDTAEGKQLDGCGYIVGELRQGRDDEAYRQGIKFRVFVNVSEGTPQALIRGLKYLTSPSDVQYLEMYPATAILFTDGVGFGTDLHDTIQDLAPAGISDVPVCVSYAAKPFRFNKQPPDGELFVNMKQDYLTANGSDITVSLGAIADSSGSRFGGVAPSDLMMNGDYLLDVNGSILVVHSNNHSILLDSGHHLTGVFQ